MAEVANYRKMKRAKTTPRHAESSNKQDDARAVGDASGSRVGLYPLIGALGLIIPFAAFLHFNLLPLVADADSFYHMRHAWVYRTNGLFDSSFPWAQYSVVRTNAADLWYGFHILTIPFSFIDPLTYGIYWAAFVTTVVSLLLIFAAFQKLGVRWPLLWLFFVPLMSSDLMYRLTMMRPHPISLGLVTLVFAYLVKEKSRSTLPAIFTIGAVLAWVHLALSWLPVFVAGVVVLVQLLHRRLPDVTRLAALGIGLALGIVLRPHPMGALNLAYIQIVKLIVEKQSDLPLHFGIELWPLYPINFYDQFIPLSILMLLAIGAVIVLLRNRQFTAIPVDARIGMWSSLTIAVVFLVLSLEVARRSHELFVAFSAVFIALLASHWPRTTKQPAGIKVAAVLAGVTLIAGPMWALHRYPQIAAGSFDPKRYQDAALWLAKNAEPGEIVFHPRWDFFGDLFFWNPRNYYINGMDPIFEFAYDPKLYWKTHYLHNGSADEMTCGAYPCVDEVISTYESLKRDFHASYIIFNPDPLKGLDEYLSRSPQFTKVYESWTGVAIYKIN